MGEMHLERKALYNLLRVNWLRDPSMAVQPWQVEDYRGWSNDDLLMTLRQLDGQVSRQQFLRYAEQCDNPEEMVSCFVEADVDPELEDQVYLIVFELWRRWVPENPSLSIFCDDLDHRIFAYDSGDLAASEHLQDAIANLLDILDENTDGNGGEPVRVFDQVAAHCANDLEAFLYDYIAEQIDDGNLQYASELLEGFTPYVTGSNWFNFLHARITAVTDIDRANELLRELVASSKEEPNLDLNLEILDFLSQTGDRGLFLEVAEKTLPLLETEEDLLDLLRCVSQYYRCLDEEEQELLIESLMEDRSDYNPEQEIALSDPVFSKLRQILSAKQT